MAFALFSKDAETGYFAPLTWEFWRSLIICFCVFNIVGHWLEIPYCTFMNECFGIVGDDYDVWTDPWYHPYWVYGIGAVVMTFVIEPIKEHILARRKTIFGAVLETFVFAVFLSMIMELVFGLIVNQPDAAGVYPYWDNSQLPLNVFGQAWLVNDVMIGVVAMLYVWVLYPLICEGLRALPEKIANAVFAVIAVGFALCCIFSYIEVPL